MNSSQVLVEVPEQWPDSAAEMGRLMHCVEAAEAMCKQIRQAVKERLESDAPVDGWTLRRGNKRQEIINIQDVFRELRQQYPDISSDDFLKCCTINQTKLNSLFQFKGPQGSLTENKFALKELLKPYSAEKQGSPVLKKSEGTA